MQTFALNDTVTRIVIKIRGHSDEETGKTEVSVRFKSAPRTVCPLNVFLLGGKRSAGVHNWDELLNIDK